MTPGEIIGWVGAFALCAVMVALAVAIVIAVVRSIRNPATKNRSTPIYRGDVR